MTNHIAPENQVPVELQCEAVCTTKGYPRWAVIGRKCSRPAQQCRDGFSVCYIHARTKLVSKWKGQLTCTRNVYLNSLTS
jgi:hypothetical protein